jgi:hypothetical protein
LHIFPKARFECITFRTTYSSYGLEESDATLIQEADDVIQVASVTIFEGLILAALRRPSEIEQRVLLKKHIDQLPETLAPSVFPSLLKAAKGEK